ncbi:MAG: hypothetical protein IT305_05825 [Chloroflexi bacterium]|nr:hypothetical protein [Chloroflexota bacterium]
MQTHNVRARKRARDRRRKRAAAMVWDDVDEEAVRRLVEGIARRVDPSAAILLREPGRRSLPLALRLAVVHRGQAVPFDLTDSEWRTARTAVGRERLARRIGAALGLQPPDQLVGPPRD